MRVCIEKSTGKLIESQSGGDDILELTEARLDTLKQNALNAGYLEADIEVKFVTDIEFEVIMEAMKPIPTYEDLRRAEMPSEHELIVALWEQVIEGRPESAAILQAKREAVKSELFPPKSKI